jgi:hypothetical protein
MNPYVEHVLLKSDRDTTYVLVFFIDADVGNAYVRIYDQDVYHSYLAGGYGKPYMYCTIGNRNFNCDYVISIDDARNVWYDAIREGWTKNKQLVNA